jgi:hypothetical protein
MRFSTMPYFLGLIKTKAKDGYRLTTGDILRKYLLQRSKSWNLKKS